MWFEVWHNGQCMGRFQTAFAAWWYAAWIVDSAFCEVRQCFRRAVVGKCNHGLRLAA